MLISEFDYELPQELIAQEPAERREDSRMLAVDRSSSTFKDRSFRDFPTYVRKGDLLVVNNTKVFPARLLGRTDTGASVELFLVENVEENKWEALAKPAKRLKPGKTVDFGRGLTAEIAERADAGRVFAEFRFEGDFFELLDEVGKTPLPPYIKREREGPDSDRSRYQTVYAKERGAIAAPTAGFHFTPDIISKVKEIGADIAEITLHVGYGTFEPVRVEDVKEHRVQSERFEITGEASELINRAMSDGRRLIAVGTTTTRALETSVARHGRIVPGRQTADLTIVPGYRFGAVDAHLTNFHLPMSSLLVLVSTFAGHSLIMEAYEHAVRERYRFYSYGDCMFVY